MTVSELMLIMIMQVMVRDGRRGRGQSGFTAWALTHRCQQRQRVALEVS
jgi:hypothetical protein